tara:strand:+ start:186 stop:701 length:516 start_codon:yes stop_codon:yes gene_type:complete
MNKLPQDIKVFNHLNFPDQRGDLKCIFESEQNLEIEGFSSKLSTSKPFVARGIHWQNQKSPQIKAISVLKGSITDFLINLDKDSEDFGNFFTYDLDADSNKTLYIPSHYGHGFFAKEETIFFYFCFGKYSEKNEITVNLKDLVNNRTSLNSKNWIISEKDRKAKYFGDIFL